MKYRAWAIFVIAAAFASGIAAQGAAAPTTKLTDAQRDAVVVTASQLRASGKLGENQGVLLQAVENGSPAAVLGLQPGDIITQYAGVPVKDAKALLALRGAATKTEPMVLLRDGVPVTVQVLPGRMGIYMAALVSLDRPSPVPAAASIHPQIGHPGMNPTAITLSRDGRLAVTAGGDGALKMWDMTTGRELRTLFGHAGYINSVKFSPDGRWLLSNGLDKTLRLWDAGTGREAFSLSTGQFGAIGADFLPGGRQAVFAGYDGKVYILDVATATVLRTLEHKYTPNATAMILSMAVSPDGKFVLTGGTDQTGETFGGQKTALKLWELASGTVVKLFPGHSKQVESVAFSPDGRRAASTSMDETVRIWDVGSGTQLHSVRGDILGKGSMFSPDGRLLAVGGSFTQIIDVASGNSRRLDTPAGGKGNLKAGNYFSSSTAFTADGQRLLTAGFETFIWDVATATIISTLGTHALPLVAMAPSPDGATIVTGGLLGLDVWDPAVGRRVTRLKLDGGYSPALAYTADGRFLVTGSEDMTVRVLDASTGRELRKLTGHSGWISTLAVTPDSTRIVSAGGHRESMWKGIQSTQYDGTLRVWNLATGEPLRVIKAHESAVQDLAISPDGTRAVSTGVIDGARAWDLASGASLWRQQDFARAVAISPDGSMVLSGGLELNLRNMADGSVVRPLKGFDGVVTAVSFSPDGRLALSGAMDNVIRVWDVASGKLLRSLPGHSSYATVLRFSPDGRRIFSSANDSTLRVWDAESGRQLALLMTFRDGEWLAITPEGYFAASSPASAEKVNISRGNEAYGVAQFYDVFYRPDIVEATLAGRDTKGLVGLTVDDALRNPPPVVGAITAPAAGVAERVKVNYQLRSAGGGIGEVRVFHNGKLVSSDGVAKPLAGALAGGAVAQQTSDKIAGQLRSLAGAAGAGVAGTAITVAAKPDVVDASIEIEPVPGDNEISVIAFNGNNSIQSVVRSVAFRSDRPAVAPRLHVLAIGIDEYKDKAANLKFAAKDAKDLGARWRTQAASIYGEGNIFVETLTNAQAGRAAILAKVEEMAARVRPTDHFMLFVASHGVLLGDQYYMVTSDYDGALTPDKLVSSGEIVDFSKRIKALSQLYILDTCHAGGMGGLVTGLYDARVSVLARKMGLHVFASASSAEEALDGHQGNGLFTHALLAGLNNNSRADRNADRQISLAELGSYSKDQTREIAASLKHKQEPLIINFGQDTAVYRLK